jgi:hypothetical protein
MRRLLAALALFPLLAAFVPAQDDEAPPPDDKIGKLTRQEVGAGWISLYDGESTFGWHAPDGSKWNVVGGMLAPEGTKPATLVCNTPFADYELVVEYRVRDQQSARVLVNADRDGKPQGAGGDKETGKEVPGVAQEPFNASAIMLQTYGRNWMIMRTRVLNGQALNTQFQTSDSRGFFAQKSATVGGDVPRPNQAHHLAISGHGLVVRAVKIRPVLSERLFNGKDLTGWKEFAGKKSKFSVDSKERTLEVKDGPGDLQTEGQWADFVLQLECKTNGKNLNSGVFFRCRPGEYQNGYEAQIHNGFGDKPKEYMVEVYDPKTHELKEKKKVESAALDYGTGAIYRRVPARVQAAKDGEWFTMTVAARGNHIATWVNGIQTADWDDNRPPKDNARNGCRLEKGPISLQGHDPTTDLSFRNIRLGDLAMTEKKEPEEKKEK